MCLQDGRRFEGVYADDYPTTGTYTDERGARFAVVMAGSTPFSAVATRGDSAFTSKAPLQVSMSAQATPPPERRSTAVACKVSMQS